VSRGDESFSSIHVRDTGKHARRLLTVKGRVEMRRLLVYVFVVSLLVMFSLPGAMAKQEELRAVCFLPKNHPLAAMTVEWVKRINDYCQGEVRINYQGGSEVRPRSEQVEALRKGAVHVAFTQTADYQSIFPEGAAFTLSKLTPWEERRPGGFYEFLAERHKNINVMYLGRWLHGSSYLWLKEPVETSADLKGRKLRTVALYDRFVKALDAVPVSLSPSETYTALEQGRVEGTGSSLLGVTESGWTKVCKYVIDHPFYSQNCTILINLDVWKEFPHSLQEKIKNLTAWFEPYMVGYFDKAIEMEWKEIEKTGVQRIHFSAADARSYLDMAYDVEWMALEEKVPGLVPLLKELTHH
jgi:TRAP-type C4-dicarboxylate transport system substrate-binding protein